MNGTNHTVALIVFTITIIVAFAFSAVGRIQARRRGGEEVWSQGLMPHRFVGDLENLVTWVVFLPT